MTYRCHYCTYVSHDADETFQHLFTCDMNPRTDRRKRAQPR